MSTDRSSPFLRSRSILLYASTAGLLLIFGVMAGVLVGAVFALPILLVAALVLGFIALSDVQARDTLARDDADPLTASTPTLGAATALGDTAEAHTQISPVDLPKDSPGYQAVKEQAARNGGTTRGNRDGGAGGPELEPENAPPSGGEGYEHDQPLSSRQAR